ncbi:hypothetical protein [Legionella longbeachae]
MTVFILLLTGMFSELANDDVAINVDNINVGIKTLFIPLILI